MKKAYLHLIKWGLARGYSIAVYGEDEFGIVSGKYKEIKDEVEACDDGHIIFVTESGFHSTDPESPDHWRRIATFFYVLEYDQVPEESIYNYGINDVSEAWARDYDEHCEVAA